MSRKPPVPVPPGHRYCFTCATLKAHSEFHRDRAARDGRCSNCKDCTRIMHRRGAAAKRELAPMIARMLAPRPVTLPLPEVDLSVP